MNGKTSIMTLVVCVLATSIAIPTVMAESWIDYVKHEIENDLKMNKHEIDLMDIHNKYNYNQEIANHNFFIMLKGEDSMPSSMIISKFYTAEPAKEYDFVGTLKFDGMNMHQLMNAVKRPLNDVSSESNAHNVYLDITKNGNGDKYLVWILTQENHNKEDNSYNVLVHIIDPTDTSNKFSAKHYVKYRE